MYNETNDKFEQVTIKGCEYVFKSQFSLTGPYFSIRDQSNTSELANVVIEKFKNDIYIFDIKVHDEKLRNKGIGTFLMCEAAKWCHEKKIPILYGKLDGEDKKHGLWEASIPFYNKLSSKTEYIEKGYFLPYLCDITDIDSFEKKSQSLEKTLVEGGSIVFLIA